MPRSPQASDAGSDSEAIAVSIDRPESFAAVFDRHYPAVYRYLARRTSSAAAEDLASITFVVAFERRGSFRPASTSARPWLLGIATNVLHERHRLQRRELDTLTRLRAERSPDADEDAGELGEIGRQRLGDALADLALAQRDVLLLHAWEELSYEEIALALEVPVGTVRSRLARARAQLRSHLEAAPFAPSRTEPSQERT
jgi:RNA polymerase sigma factor (sigma-70 family)